MACIDKKRATNPVGHGVCFWMWQEKSHRALFAWIERDASVDGAILREVCDGMVGGFWTGTVELFWNGEYTQFGNLAKEEYLPEQNV